MQLIKCKAHGDGEKAGDVLLTLELHFIKENLVATDLF